MGVLGVHSFEVRMSFPGLLCHFFLSFDVARPRLMHCRGLHSVKCVWYQGNVKGDKEVGGNGKILPCRYSHSFAKKARKLVPKPSYNARLEICHVRGGHQ